MAGNQVPNYVENFYETKFNKLLPKFRPPTDEESKKKKLFVIESMIDLKDIEFGLQSICSPVVDTAFEIKIFASQVGYGLESEIYSKEIEFIKYGDEFKSGSKYINGRVFRRGADQGTQQKNYGYESRKIRSVLQQIER